MPTYRCIIDIQDEIEAKTKEKAQEAFDWLIRTKGHYFVAKDLECEEVND